MNENNPISRASKLSGISTKEIIEALNISKREIKELDDNPYSITMDRLEELADMTGVDITRLKPEKKIQGPCIKATYEAATDDLIQLIERERESCNKLLAQFKDVDDSEVTNVLAKIKDDFENLTRITMEGIRKPLVCAFGNSDTGKSTLINYFLGEQVAKTNYSPLTSTVVYYQHISDMPDHLKVDAEFNAFVFGEPYKASAAENSKTEFTHEDIYHQETAQKYLIASGKHQDIIDQFSSRESANYQEKQYKVFEIVVFLDKDILRELSFIDIPGFESGDKEDDIGLTMKMNSVDILFYLMVANGFMRESDLAHLNHIIKCRNTLKGMYVLATQANVIGSPLEIEQRLDSGYDIYMRWLTEKERSNKDINYAEKFRACFYGFDIKNKKLCEKLNQAIEQDVPAIIEAKISKQKKALEESCKKSSNKYHQERIQILTSRSSEKKNSEEIEAFLNERKKDIRLYGTEIKKQIEYYRKQSLAEFHTTYDEYMNKSNLVRRMEEKKLKNKKEEIKNFSTLLNKEIDERTFEILATKSTTLTKELNEWLEKYKESWNGGGDKEKLSVDFSGFDFEKAFFSGLVGVGTYGALAAWAAVVAGGSNLGGYILLAKVVSSLSAMGISLGGTSTVAAAVAAIGGPVTIGIAVAVLGTISAYAFFSGNWKQRLANNLIKSYEKELKEKEIEQINVYWDNTITEVDSCLTSLDSSLLEHYHMVNVIQERTACDSKLYEAINRIYYTVDDIYSDIHFYITTNKERSANSIFVDEKNLIIEQLEQIKEKKTKYRLDSDINDFESLVFLEPEEKNQFWEDLSRILEAEEKGSIELTNDMFLYKKGMNYAVYFQRKAGCLTIRYIDTYPYTKKGYDRYKNLIVNTYPLKNDQIRYKIFDMISMAKKEVLIIIPWINSHGWDDKGNYGKSMKEVFETALQRNPELRVLILAGYDLLHEDSKKETETNEKAASIMKEFRNYGKRFKIITGIGTHEKRITIDNICALSGSYNFLSNIAPYKDQPWAADSMEVLENPYNIERQRREILERAGRKHTAFA